MDDKLKNILLDTFRPIREEEDEGIDERFYEFVDEETLKEFLRQMDS